MNIPDILLFGKSIIGENSGGSGGSGDGIKMIKWVTNTEEAMARPHIEGIGYFMAEADDPSVLENSFIISFAPSDSGDVWSMCTFAEYSTSDGRIFELEDSGGVLALGENGESVVAFWIPAEILGGTGFSSGIWLTENAIAPAADSDGKRAQYENRFLYNVKE